MLRNIASLVLGILAALSAQVGEPAPFKIVTEDGGVAISEGDAKVLRYQRETKSLEGKFPRANYVHPLYDLDGNELTEDFPRDHLHQRGIFWAWHQVTIGGKPVCDTWTTENTIWNVREVKTDQSADQATIHARVDWQSPRWLDAAREQKPFVREETTIRVHRAEGDRRAVDFEIQLLALEPDLKIGGAPDDKGYGGFSPRLRLPADVRFLSQQGELATQMTAMNAGSWVDVSATFGSAGATSGIAILCHPSLPVFPPPWILRRKGSMQNAVYPGAKPVALSTETPLVLRYRLIVHRGKVTVEQVDKWQSQYASQH